MVFAKTGTSGVNILPGKGEILFPLWNVPPTYTFATGALFIIKKGEGRRGKILVAATIPVASQPVTDIFRVAPSAGFIDKIAEREAALSGGSLSKPIKNHYPPPGR